MLQCFLDKRISYKYGIFIMIVMFLAFLSITVSAEYGIRDTTYDEFNSLIYQAKGSSLVVCIYSSDCPASRQQIPIVNAIGKTYRPRGLKMIVLSTDEAPRQLANYLSGNDLYFEPLWLSQKREGGLAAILRGYGGNYKNAVPYSALLDRSGTVIKDWTGVMNYNGYCNWVEYLLKR